MMKYKSSCCLAALKRSIFRSKQTHFEEPSIYLTYKLYPRPLGTFICGSSSQSKHMGTGNLKETHGVLMSTIIWPRYQQPNLGSIDCGPSEIAKSYFFQWNQQQFRWHQLNSWIATQCYSLIIANWFGVQPPILVKSTHQRTPSLKLKVHPWKSIVGRWHFCLRPGLFSGRYVRLLHFRERISSWSGPETPMSSIGSSGRSFTWKSRMETLENSSCIRWTCVRVEV